MKQPVKMVKTAGDLVILLKDFKANSKIVGHPLFIKKQVFFSKNWMIRQPISDWSISEGE